MNTKIIEIPPNYSINKIEDGKIYLEPNSKFINSISELESLNNYSDLSLKYPNLIKLFKDLLILRDNYRDNDEPFNINTVQYAIIYENGEVFTIATIGDKVFTFQTEKVAKLFLENFKSEIITFYKMLYKF